MKRHILSCLLLTLGATTARADHVNLTTVVSGNLFVPVGFDDNDESQVVLDGYLPNSCYRIAEPSTSMNLATRTVKVQARARYIPGIHCTRVPVPFTVTVKLGVLPRGTFEVQADDGLITERLDVAPATSAGPDDFLYAPIDNATVQTTEAGEIKIMLQGRFTNTCMKWEEEKVYYTGRTIQLLPVISLQGGNCEEREQPFERLIPLRNVPPGRYLLHVRSLSGEARNVVFTAVDTTR